MKELITNITTYLYPWALSHGIKVIAIIIWAYIINKIAKKFIENFIRIIVISDKLSSEDSERKREDTLIHIFIATFKIVLFILTILMILQELWLMIQPILAAAWIVGLAFGFGWQYLIRDIISGLFIILENQYRIGDVVQFDNVGWVVEWISMRMTTLRDLDWTVHHVPHGEIKTVSNLSKYFARVNLNIGIAYNANLEHVIETINTTWNELSQDPNWQDSIIDAPQFLRVDDFADSAIIIKILWKTKPLKQWEVTWELRKRLKIAFDKEGIEIPFPQMVVYKK